MDIQNIKAQIRQYIAKNLLFSGNNFKYSDDASFLEEGIVDSLGIMDLTMHIQETYGVTINDAELTPDNFDSVNKVAQYIQSKLAETVH
jgi:acyl carrier protein